jgi:DNA polymerase zeta
MAHFKIRLNCIDHYQATPTDFDPPLPTCSATWESHLAPTVPVIRVFGATENGQKACAHIHGAFPYLYIDYDGILTDDEGGQNYLISWIHSGHSTKYP